MSEKEFARAILKWFDHHKRILPWRDTRDPYLIWISEIILQQTRVAQGLSYYNEFVKEFPTIQALANASEVEVLRLWEGLGYYSRARNLHRSARLIANEMGGHFPRSFDKLVDLPGIGPYTAAAIASIAFDERVAVVDGNVFRVMGRIFGIDEDTASPKGRRVFFEHTMRFVPASRPGDFNQALMEFGALHCTPTNPACVSCPFSPMCVAYKSDSIDLLPVKKKKNGSRNRYLNYFVFLSAGKVAMKRRSGNDIWQGLYDFYMVETSSRVTPAMAARKDKRLRHYGILSLVEIGRVVHHLSHQKLSITFISAKVEKENLTKINAVSEPLAFYSLKQAEGLPKPVPVKAIIEKMRNGRKRN